MLKRYQASERKLQWLRRRGIRPVSHTVIAAVIVAGAVGAVIAGANAFVSAAGGLVRDAMSTDITTAAGVFPWLWRAGALIGVSVGCIAAVVVCAWLVSVFVQGGSGTVSSGGEDVSYYSMNRSQVADTAVRALIAAIVIIAAVYAAIETAGAIGESPTAGTREFARICCIPAVTTFLPAAAGAAVLDWIWCRYAYFSAARMGEQEKRRELRDTESSPLIQQRLSQRRQEESSS
ncbi:MAG: EscU/YscU/HrcU family type III secretion system export apparatus switch protein [Armatimonadota bacterium]